MIGRTPEWLEIPDKEKEKLGLTVKDDGEFWMPFDDFLSNFTELSICRLINTSVFSFSKTWKEAQQFGCWMRGEGMKTNRAGGCLNHKETFLQNPQYRFDIDCNLNDTREIIVQLSQRDARTQIMERKDNFVIGFCILKVEDNRKYR